MARLLAADAPLGKIHAMMSEPSQTIIAVTKNASSPKSLLTGCSKQRSFLVCLKFPFSRGQDAVIQISACI
eukprot:scaffold408053_cov22-Prasinocladus_malaysianus.AAC.1